MKKDIPSYVVHYKGNVDRKNLIVKLFAKEKMENVIWILDYDKEEISYELYVKNFQADHLEHQRRGQDPNEFFPRYPLQPEVVSLALKQKEVYRRIGYGENKVGIMFEDDAIICENFKETLHIYLNSVPLDWDVLFIGQGGGKRIPKDKLQDGVFWYKKDHPADRCADSIIFKKEAAKKIYDHIDHYKICFAGDAELAFWMKVLNMNVYWLEPPIVVQGSQNGLFKTIQPASSTYIDESMQTRTDMDEILKS
jgi:hypothetical protein